MVTKMSKTIIERKQKSQNGNWNELPTHSKLARDVA